MANLFDVANAPTTEPVKMVVGDFLQWKRTDLVTDYPTDLYTAEYVARVTGGGDDEIKLAQDAGTTSEYYLFKVSTALSETFATGFYHWQLEITEIASGNRIVVDKGEFEAVPDLDSNQADPRAHAEIMVAKIESLLEGKADSDVAEYTIAGRSLTKMPMADLMKARDYYAREVSKLKAKAAIEQGRSSKSTIQVRFV